MDTTHKRYPLAVAIPILSFVAIALCIPPLILHTKNRNFPAASLICWSLVLNLFNIINALLWPTDDVDSWWDGTGLCDVEVKIMVAGYVAVPGTIMCIFRSLAIVLDTNRATLVPTKTQRLRNHLMNTLFCVIVPVIAMITHYVWQRSRYYLYAISGCVNNFDESWVSFVLAYMWPPIICLIAGYYCCLVLIRLRRYRSDFVNILRASQSNMSKSRFLRLFFLAFTMLIAIIPVQGYVVYYDLTLSLPWHPYSWSRIHGPAWHQIIKVPTQGLVFFDRWTPIASAVMIFIFFGFGRDATRMYRTFFWKLGLGKCFPNVARPVDSRATAPAANTSSATTVVGSLGSKAKLLFGRRKAPAPQDAWPGSLPSTRTSYNDIEKGTTSHPNQPPQKTSWFRSPWFRMRQRLGSRVQDRDTRLEDLSVPSQSICTNAWAGASQSRGSSELASGPASPELPEQREFICVKQVISQQSEMQG